MRVEYRAATRELAPLIAAGIDAEGVKQSVRPASARLRKLENCATLKRTALKGCAIEITRLIHNEITVRPSSFA